MVITILELADISISYSLDVPLITGFSCVIKPGQLRLLRGASGSGKSSLLSLICGTPAPALIWSGDMYLNDKSLNPIPAEQRNIGLLFQDPLLFPHMTVAENLAFGLAETNRKHRREAVLTALTQAGLNGFGDRDPASLSGGQAARIGLMRSLLAKPDALLMDEAFSSLDPDMREQFGGFVLSQIKQRHIPALLVSHDSGDAVFASNEIIQL